MKKIYTTIIISLFACSLFAQTSLTTAPDFTVTDVTGTQFNLYTMLAQGKHVCIDFFFTTCPPCIATSPYFKQTFQDYGCNTGDIYFISIDIGDNNAQCIQYEIDYLGGNAGYPVVSGDDGNGNAVCNTFGIGAYPTYILIAPNHSIIEQDMWPISSPADFTAFISPHGLNPMPCLTGITDLPAVTGVSVFPNPATDVLNITSPKKLDSYKIYNATGTLTDEGVLDGKSKNGFSVNVKDLEKGVYFIHLSSEKSVQTFSFAKL